MKEIIKVKNLKKTYGNKVVVNNLDFSIDKGEVFGLLGANGAGKSTTIECMLGTKKADKGVVSILGMNPLEKRKDIFEQVGVQFQETNYQDKIRVFELCEEIQSLYKQPNDYKKLLKKFGLFEKMTSLVSDLSGGQRQKLFIILALIPNPKIVFLDELTTGLDPRSRREVWSLLSQLKKEGLTIFLTSHFMDEIEYLCDHIMILNKGEVVFYGSVQEAVENSPYNQFEDAYLWYTKEDNTL